MPDLIGKSREDVINILENLKLKYHFKGTGKAIMQRPEPGTEVDINSIIEVEFSN